MPLDYLKKIGAFKRFTTTVANANTPTTFRSLHRDKQQQQQQQQQQV